MTLSRVFMSGVLLAGIGLGVAACGGGGDDGGGSAQAADQPRNTPTTAPSHVEVQVLDNLFEPRIRSAKVNEEVRWVWDSANQHSVTGTYNGATVESPAQAGGSTFSFTFTTPGTFAYTCGVHGESMKGQIIIQ